MDDIFFVVTVSKATKTHSWYLYLSKFCLYFIEVLHGYLLTGNHCQVH